MDNSEKQWGTIYKTGAITTIFAMPAGLLVMDWMIMFTIKLFKLSR